MIDCRELANSVQAMTGCRERANSVQVMIGYREPTTNSVQEMVNLPTQYIQTVYDS